MTVDGNLRAAGRAPRRRRPAYILRVTAVALLPLAASLAISAGRAQAAMPGISGKIAFVSDRSGATEIYSMYPDGSQLTQLTSIGGDTVFGPAWSPDGTRIAFARVEWCFGCPWSSIYVVNADGTGLRSLGASGTHSEGPTWSPDGSKIAYWARSSGYDNIYVMNADGSQKTLLISGEEPAWSPDGSKIAYYKPADASVHVMNADGSGDTRLATGSHPEWSPDGSKIAYTSTGSPNGTPILVMNSDGTGQRSLAAKTDTKPSWSPDGQRITYQRSGTLFTANADGTGETSLTGSVVKNGITVDGNYPSWQRPVQVLVREQGNPVYHPMPASPYPFPVRLQGYSGIVSDVTVTLQGVTHTRPSDLDVVLVGPGGQAVTLLSDAGSGPANNVTLTFSDAAPSVLPQSGALQSGTWFVTNYDSYDPMPSPAPAWAPYGNTLSVFKNTDPNGIWNLYVSDDAPGADGWIASWSLDVRTGGIRIDDAAPASPYPATKTISGYPCCIGEVRVTLNGLTHTWTEDLDVVLVGPQGQAVTLLSDVGGSTGVSDVTVTFTDSASSVLPRYSRIASGWWKPTNYDSGDPMAWPAPNPAPYGYTLSVFGGTDPNGTWRLYVVDDAGRDAGFVRDWTLDIMTYTYKYAPPSCC
jgi:Tol biopolymer transport system component